MFILNTEFNESNPIEWAISRDGNFWHEKYLFNTCTTQTVS